MLRRLLRFALKATKFTGYAYAARGLYRMGREDQVHASSPDIPALSEVSLGYVLGWGLFEAFTWTIDRLKMLRAFANRLAGDVADGIVHSIYSSP